MKNVLPQRNGEEKGELLFVCWIYISKILTIAETLCVFSPAAHITLKSICIIYAATLVSHISGQALIGRKAKDVSV